MPTPDLGVVVALSRPERLPHIIEQFRAQRYGSAELVLCLNGRASGMRPGFGTWIECEGGTPARPRNAGLRYLRNRSVPLVAFWDDDDYYGPGQLEELASALREKRRRVVGKYARFVRYDDGLYYLLGRQATFLGGTMGGWVEELPPIPDLPMDEELVWCREMRAAGFELMDLGPRHYVYNRLTGHHAWWSTKIQTLHTYGPAYFLGNAPGAIADEGFDPSACEYVGRPTLSDITAELAAMQAARAADFFALEN